MRKKVLFIDREQFGSLTDSLKYCEYLHDIYDITYICLDKRRKRETFPNLKVYYTPHFKSKLLRGIAFIIFSLIYTSMFKGKIIVLYFPKCEIIKKILFWKNIHIDIRTLSVKNNEDDRIKENNSIQKCINYFNSVSFITSSIANSIFVKDNIKKFILPLGADIISHSNKDFSTLKLLYIGTLENRDIIKTIQGVELFLKKHNTNQIIYNIIGDGNDFELINSYIQEHQLTNYIKMLGRLPYNKLGEYLDNFNIGVSFIPMTNGYNLQPPTKTYEYILSGLFCIATKTKSNCDIVINDINGYLIEDTPASFSDALEHICINNRNYNSTTIRNTLLNNQWNAIIEKYLIPIIES